MKRFKSLLMLTLLATLIACGGKEEKKKEENSLKIGTTEKTKKDTPKSVEVTLNGNDMMKYNKSEIKVKAGQEVTLVLTHVGKLDKKVMGHNFVLLKPGVSIQEFSLKASDAGEAEDWIPENGKDVIVHTKMLGGGESDSITFAAPEKGTYDFICSFPGHSALMKGKFIVE